MNKLFFALLLALSLSACASSLPPSIQPIGELSPVNPAKINVADLKVK